MMISPVLPPMGHTAINLDECALEKKEIFIDDLRKESRLSGKPERLRKVLRGK